MPKTNPPKVKGVFFDLYGTLLNLGDMKRAWSDWMEVLYGSLCSQEMAMTREKFGDSCHEFFGKEEPIAEIADGLTVFERRINRLAMSLGSRIGMAQLKDAATRAVNAWQRYVELDPDAPAVLSALAKTKKLALISNFDHPPHSRRILRETGLAQRFDSIIISGEVGIKKPNPEIFRFALQETALNADEVVYVGDTQEDVDGATAAGIKPILIVRPEEPERPKILDYTRNHQAIAGQMVFNNSVLTIKSLRDLVDLV